MPQSDQHVVDYTTDSTLTDFVSTDDETKSIHTVHCNRDKGGQTCKNTTCRTCTVPEGKGTGQTRRVNAKTRRQGVTKSNPKTNTRPDVAPLKRTFTSILRPQLRDALRALDEKNPSLNTVSGTVYGHVYGYEVTPLTPERKNLRTDPLSAYEQYAQSCRQHGYDPEQPRRGWRGDVNKTERESPLPAALAKRTKRVGGGQGRVGDQTLSKPLPRTRKGNPANAKKTGASLALRPAKSTPSTGKNKTQPRAAASTSSTKQQRAIGSVPLRSSPLALPNETTDVSPTVGASVQEMGVDAEGDDVDMD
ncbi:hypothetical protein LTR66_004977 [Elasticomyces elasticus]|nr:hypothetical protein LTR66_004977 [Elasticomyces elasticus]